MTAQAAAAQAAAEAPAVSTPWLLVLVGVLLLAIALGLFLLLRRGVKTVADEAAGGGERAPLLLPAGPRRSFAAGVAALRTYLPGRDGRYRVPWVAVMGTGGSGTSTVADAINLPRPFQARAAEDANGTVRWSFFEQGVLLDLPGAWVRRRGGEAADTAAWRTFLRLLRRHRPGRPLDGLVLTLAADELAATDADGRQALLAQAELVRERLAEAQQRLGVRVPLHVLVTRCDRIPGFTATCRELPEAALDEVFGWSSPYPPGASFSPGWVDEAYDQVGAGLYETQVELLADSAPERADGLFRFPAELRRTLPSLRGFLGEVFRESAYHEAFFFRGIYFTGDPAAPESFATDLAPFASDAADPSLPPAEQAAFASTDEDGDGDADGGAAPAGIRAAAPVFLRDLFAERVFAEAGLARPVGGTWRDGGQGTRAAQGLAAAILVLGIPVLLLAGHRLNRTSTQVQGALETSGLVLTQLEAETQPDASSRTRGQPNVLLVVEQMGDLPVDRLWSLFIPASWPAYTRDRLRAAQVASFRDAVYPAMLHRLHAAADALTAPEPGAATGRWHPSAATPTLLTAYLRELGTFSENVNRYNDLATPGKGTPDDLQQLTSYLYRLAPPPATTQRRRAYAWAVSHATAERLSGDRTDDAVQRARDLASAVYDRLAATLDQLEEGAAGVPASLDPLTDEFEGVRRDGASAGAGTGWTAGRPERTGGYAFAVQDDGFDDEWAGDETDAGAASAQPFTAARLSGYFAGADSVWLVPGPPDNLPPAMEAALAALQESALLDADEFRRDFTLQFAQERASRLGGLDPAGLGQPGAAAQAARSVVALRDALSTLQAQPFAGGGLPVELRATLPAGAPVSWDTAALGAALGRYEAYQAFVGAPGVAGLPARPRNLVRTLGTAQLEAGMTLDVARAARSGGSGAMLLAGGGERQLRARVAGLQTAAPQLARVLAAYRAAGLAPAYDDLATVVAVEGESILAAAEQLLEAGGLYLPRDGGFDWWNGETPLAFAAFGAADTAGLAAWLADQRASVQDIYSAYAEPVLALLGSAPLADFAAAPTPEAAAAVEAAELWTEIGEQLAAYTAKKPSSLGSLESLVTGAMMAVAPGSCAAAVSRGGGGSDWFAQRRERLRSGVWARCRQLSTRAAAAGYGRLRDAFQSTLTGRFPFADADVRDEATPTDVAAFFRLYAQSAAVRESVETGSDGVGGPGSAAAAFLARMDAAAAFLAPLLGADTAGGPAYLARPEFRVAREREAGADQVAEWQLHVGRASLTPRDSAGASLPWTAGAPVSLTFRWAEGSPVRPVAAGLPAGARVSGPALVYGYGGDWALLRLLRARAAAGPAHTLGFEATTVAAPPSVPHATPGDGAPGPALLLVRLRLYDPATGRERVLPPFPTDAPAAGGGSR